MTGRCACHRTCRSARSASWTGITNTLSRATSGDQMKVWLARTPETAVCVSFNRSDGSFSDRDAAILDVLQPHLLVFHQVGADGAAAAEAERVLTRREAQVLTCLLSGRDNDAIARLLFISPGTVRKHLEHAYEKLGVGNRSEAMAVLLRIGPRQAGRQTEEEGERLTPFRARRGPIGQADP